MGNRDVASNEAIGLKRLQEIGDRYGISRERVRQVEKNIIKKMREYFKKEIPDFAAYTDERVSD